MVADIPDSRLSMDTHGVDLNGRTGGVMLRLLYRIIVRHRKVRGVSLATHNSIIVLVRWLMRVAAPGL